jgi:hypothetical protein
MAFSISTTIFKAYNERKVMHPGATLADMMDVWLAAAGLSSWNVLGVLGRERCHLTAGRVASGQRFDHFIRQGFLIARHGRHGFVVPEQSRSRLAAYYAGADLLNPLLPGLTRTDDAPYPGVSAPVPKLSGGGGLVTLPTCWRRCEVFSGRADTACPRRPSG